VILVSENVVEIENITQRAWTPIILQRLSRRARYA